MQIYLTKNGRQDGPHTLDHINAEARAGRLQPGDLAWVEGWPVWQAVSNVSGFVGLPTPPPLSPTFPPLAVPSPRASEKEALLRTFVGPNYGYYFRKWAEAERKSKQNTWNWAAFFLCLWWLAYRKMYGYAGLYLAILALAAIGDFACNLNSSLSSCIKLALAIIFGLNGNRWYRLRAEQRIRQIAPSDAADEVTRSCVAQAGGTSGWAVVLFTIAFIVMVGIGEASVSEAGKSGSSAGAGITTADGKGGSPSRATTAAFKAYQKVEHDNLSTLPPGEVGDPSKLAAAIKVFRDIAFGESQLELDGVDQLLVDHLHHRMNEWGRVADVLESKYADIVDVINRREGNIELSRKLGGALAGDKNRQGGSDLVEWLYRLGTDDDFQQELRRVDAKHQPEVDAMTKELSQTDAEEKATADALKQKYGVDFVTIQ